MSKTRPTPLKNYVLAIENKPKTVTDSGIYLPTDSKKQRTAVINEVGAGVIELRVGDEIIYRVHDTVEVTVSGTKYLLIEEEKVLAKITKEEGEE